MPPQVGALIWDVDGVFVDTECLHFEAWNRLLAEFGCSMTLEEYRPLIGRAGKDNLASICRLKGISGDLQELHERRRTLFRDLRKNGIPVIEANVALVRDFAAVAPHIRQGVASSATDHDILENLEAAGLGQFFRSIASYQTERHLRRKPDPDLHLLAARLVGVNPSDCVAFEDSEAGAAAARAAGMRCVALPNPLTLGQDFSAAFLVLGPEQRRDARDLLQRLTA